MRNLLIVLALLVTAAVVAFVVSTLGDDTSGDGGAAVVTHDDAPRSGVDLPHGSRAGGDAAGADVPSTLDAPAPTADIARAVLVGRVVSADGPVAGAAVHVLLEGGAARDLAEAWSACPDAPAAEPAAVTGPDGRFRAEAARPERAWGHAVVAITGEALVPAARKVELTADGRGDAGDVPVLQGTTVAGRAVGEDGVPLEGVRVARLVDADTAVAVAGSDPTVSPFLRSSDVSTTCADGRFRFVAPRGGALDLRFEAEDRAGVERRGLSAAQPDLDTGDTVLPLGGRIAGRLVDGRGAPLADCWVTAILDGVPSSREVGSAVVLPRGRATVLTAEDGAFAFGGLADGSFSLHARGTGTGWARRFDVAVGVTGVELVAPDGASFVLDVRDAVTRAPVDGVAVDVESTEEAARWPHGDDAVAIAGDEAGLGAGAVRLDALDAAGAVLVVTAPGYGRAEVETGPLVGGGVARREVLLPRALHIAGRVETPDGLPIPAVMLQAGAPGMPGGRATTGADGRFSIPGLRDGTWQVWPSSKEHLGVGHRTVVLAGADLDDLLMVLVPTATLAGTVREAGEPTAATVAALLVDPDWERLVERLDDTVIASSDARSYVSVSAGEDGLFELERLAPGTHLVTAVSGEGADPRAVLETARAADAPPEGVVRLTVAAGETVERDLIVPSAASVSGHVTLGGRSAADAFVAVMARVSGAWTSLGTAVADGAGSFTIGELPRGDAVVVARGATSPATAARVVELRSGDTPVQLDVSGVSALVRVVDDVTGLPVTDAVVRVGYRPTTDSSLGLGDAEALQLLVAFGAAAGDPFEGAVDGRGEVTLVHLAPGRHTVYAQGDGWMPSSGVPLQVVDGETPEPVEVRLRAGALVRGRVDGVPLEATGRLVAELVDPARGGIAKWVEVADGAYELVGLSPGRYRLRVRDLSSGGGVRAERDLDLDAGEALTVDLRLD